ncbi:MAG: hypothetical protein PHI48_03600 [Bacteroidales bacterium]|nr:hypothetical protein [Bacteroidales bacterium]MDD4821625.1 hypothetical protein [Bacteroidales bacterium]
MKTIEELLDKYFEGATSCAEEQQLKDYFSQEKEIPSHLQAYREMFVSLALLSDVKRKKEPIMIMTPVTTTIRRHRIFMQAAASVAILFCLSIGGGMYYHSKDAQKGYVIINGERSTDKNLIISCMENSMAAVTDYPEDVLFLDGEYQE